MIAIPVTFVFLSCLILWLLIGSKGYWLVKVIVMFLTIWLAFEMNRSLNTYFGYPKKVTVDKLAGQQIDLIWVKINEPDELIGDSGAVYLWVLQGEHHDRTWMDYSPPKSDPEALKLPYSRPLHEQAQEALTQIVKSGGEPVEIGVNKQGSGSGGKTGGSGMTGEGYEIYVLPPPRAQPKVSR